MAKIKFRYEKIEVEHKDSQYCRKWHTSLIRHSGATSWAHIKQRRTEPAPKLSLLEPFQHLGGVGSLITVSAYADWTPTDFSRARANALRFDLFEHGPRYHYISLNGQKQTIIDFDRVAFGEMLPWALSQLRHRIVPMPGRAGGENVAREVESNRPALKA